MTASRTMASTPLPAHDDEIAELHKQSVRLMQHGQIDDCKRILEIVANKDTENLSDHEKEMVVVANSNLGYLWLNHFHNPMRAYSYLIRGMEISSNIDRSKMRKSCMPALYNNLGQLYMAFNDKARAFEHYRASFHEALKENTGECVITSFVDLLYCAWTVDSLSIINKELDTFNNYKGSYVWLNQYSRQLERAARLYLRQDYKGAISGLDSALKVLDTPISRERYEAYNRLIAAKVAIISGDMEESRRLLAEAESVIVPNHISDLTEKLYRLQAEQEHLSDNKSGAIDKMYTLLAIRDSLFNSQQYGMVLDQKAAMDASNQERRLAIANAESSKRLTIIIFLATLATAITLFVIIVMAKNMKLRESNRELFRKNLELIETENRNKPISIAGDGEHTKEADSMPDDEARMICEKVREKLLGDSDIYDPDYSIENLATSTGIRVKSISTAIRIITGKNFSTFMAEIRIREACRILLSASSKARPTMEALAERVGYKSRSHFLRVFKSVTGLTTTEFLRRAAESKENTGTE